jgi:hypothetical protein
MIMTYTPPVYGAPPPPKRKMSGGTVAGIIILALLAICCTGVIISIAKGGSGDKALGNAEHLSVQPSPSTHLPKSGPPASKAVEPRGLAAADLKLTVKTTKKECFGSAGCNVEFTIDAALLKTVKFDGPCDVTYEVHGLSDTQTNTLTIQDDEGTYEQDGFQFGQTSSSKKKLTAKVADVVCR